jgi:hypothetical protein
VRYFATSLGDQAGFQFATLSSLGMSSCDLGCCRVRQFQKSEPSFSISVVRLIAPPEFYCLRASEILVQNSELKQSLRVKVGLRYANKLVRKNFLRFTLLVLI